MSLASRKSKLSKARKMTPERAQRMRVALGKAVDKTIKKDAIRFAATAHLGKGHFVALEKYLLAEANETAAAVLTAKSDQTALRRKYLPLKRVVRDA